MVKQTKTFKKGNVTKKALSAILAASMVMTSSSFVMAAPVDVVVETEEVSVNAENAEVVEEAETEEEAVGAAKFSFKNRTFTVATTLAVKDNMNKSAVYDAIVNNSDTKIERTIEGRANNVVADSPTLGKFVAADDFYDVTITNEKGETVALTNTTVPTKAGTYTITVSGNDKIVQVNNEEWVATGTITGTLDITHVASTESSNVITAKYKNPATGEYDQSSYNATYTGEEIKPDFKLYDVQNNELKAGADYEILSYGNNKDVTATAPADDDKPYVEILFKKPYADEKIKKYTFTIVGQADISSANTKITVTNDKTAYNADVQQPVLKVEYKTADGKTVELKQDVDYTMSIDKEPKDVDTYIVTITGLNNYQGILTKEYKIEKQNFNETTLKIEIPEVPYKGEGDIKHPELNKNRATVLIKDAVSGKKLQNQDYEILYYDESKSGYVSYPVATKPGTYAIKICAKGDNYNKGEIKTTYKVVAMEDTLKGFVAKNGVGFGNSTKGKVYGVDGYEYDKDGTVPATVTVGNRTFYDDGRAATGTNGDIDTRFTVVFPEEKDCKDVGYYGVKLVGTGLWAGQEMTVSYKVVAKEFDNNKLTNAVKVYKDHSGKVTVDFKDTLTDNCHKSAYDLVEGKDYTYTLSKAGTQAGTQYKVEVTYKGNYTGKSVKNVSFGPETELPLSVEAITAEVTGEYMYTGATIRPTIDNIVLKENGKELRAGVDYEKTLSYGKNIEVGQGTVTVTGMGAYTGTRTIIFEIKAAATVKDNYVLDTTGLKAVYETGSAFDPKKDIRVKTKSGRTLSESEYDVKYYRNGKEVSTEVAKTAGTTTMEVTVRETKTVLTAAYRVATSISKAAEVKDIADQAFTGEAVRPAVTVLKSGTTVPMTEGTDYVVSYTNNVKQGTATVIIEGIGDYYGTINKTFKIAGQAEQSIAVLAAQARDIQNRTLNSTPTVVKFEAGKAPKTAVTYASSDEDVVKVDETGKITYTGLGEATITIKAAETAEYKAAEATMTVKVGLAKPSFTPFSKNNAFTLTSSTVKGAEKFEVQYATKKDFSNKKSVKFTATSGKVRQVKVSAGDKKTYYVRVRAISGTETSAWSTTKTVATK